MLATAENLKKLGIDVFETNRGGKVIVAPIDIPNVGRFAVILDKQGAALSVIAYKPMPA